MSGEPLSLHTPLIPIAAASRTAPPDVRTALEPVYDRCAASLYRYFMVRTSRNHDLASDLMQQLWLAALRNAAGVPADELEFWLRSVAGNLLATHWRRAASAPLANRDPRLANDLAARLTEQPLPESVLTDADTQHQLLLALTELPADDQDLLIAHYLRSVPQSALAQQLGVSVRAIEGRLYRARQALKDLLASQ
ncbi:MAG: RNA polymerase sigma factor [Phycisphaerales bacterium]